MRNFILQHRHEPDECDAAFAAWAGFESPLRHALAPTTCLAGGHDVFWNVTARDAAAALALLPRFVAQRTRAVQVREVEIP